MIYCLRYLVAGLRGVMPSSVCPHRRGRFLLCSLPCRGILAEKGGEIVDILSTIVVLIPSVLSLCVSGIYAYIALKKAKEPQKDEIWETATRIMCSSGQSTYADEFIELYVQLKFFKEHQDLFPNIKPISGLMDEYEEQKKVISKDVGHH